MKQRPLLLGTVVWILPATLWAQTYPFTTYEAGFESSGEAYGDYSIGTVGGQNGWTGDGRVTNSFAAPGGGSQSLFVDGNLSRHTVTPDGLVDTNISRISFDWFTPATGLSNDWSVIFSGQGVEMIFRNSVTRTREIQIAGSNGLFQPLLSGGPQFRWTNDVWYHFEINFLHPGSDSLLGLKILTNDVEVYSGSNAIPAGPIPFGRINQPNPTNTDILFLVGTFTEPVDGIGWYVDNILIEAVPEPSSSLLILLVAAFGAWLRGRKEL